MATDKRKKSDIISQVPTKRLNLDESFDVFNSDDWPELARQHFNMICKLVS